MGSRHLFWVWATAMCLYFPSGNPATNNHIPFSGAPLQAEPRTPYGVYFVFKNRSHWLRYGIGVGKGPFGQPSRTSAAQLDTLSNWYSRERMYVEIIRQDDPLQPTLGMALGFEFDESYGEYPYTPRFARLQLKNFAWGGLEFSKRDTFNYTGVSNAVSDDLTVEVDFFSGDSIAGRFSGLLLSGAGPMAALDSGAFAVKLRTID